MKKKILKIFMLLFLSIVFFACGNDSEKVRSKIEKHLYEKYGEEFVVDRIGTRSADGQKFYQARIYPKSIIGTNREGDSYYYAKSNIDIKPFGRLGKVGDSYDIVQFNEGIEKYVEAKAKELFGNRIRIKSDSKYKKNVNGRFYWAFQHDFLRAKEIVKNDDNYRIEMSLYIYIFDRIETEKDKEQRREEIFEFIQYLKNEGENAKGHIKIKGTLLGENISIIEKESESRWRIVEELYSYLEGEREKKKKEVLKEHEDVEQYKEVINVQFENEDGVEEEREVEVRYLYIPSKSFLFIQYGEGEKYEHKYGNGIEIENFENYNFGIDLAIDYPILFGSAYNRREGEKRDYKFVKGFPMAYFPKSNGQGTITVDKKDLKSLEFTNIYDRDQVENEDFKLVIDLIETDIKYDENYGFKSRDEKYLLIYNSHREELTILYKNREEDETIMDLYRSRKAKEEYTIKGYKKILIKDFKNKDYGIKIPYNSTTLYGSLVKSVYTVVEGDSLWKIAEKELNSGQRWRELLHYNCEPVTLKNPKLLKIGEKIIIPKD